jgi:hypothetical protein
LRREETAEPFMKPSVLVGLAAAIGAIALSGCAPAPVAAVAPPPPPRTVFVMPPLVAVAVPVPLVPPAPPVWHRHVARVTHPVMHHHWVHRYSSVQVRYTPTGCGSSEHPCNVEHVTVPVE